MGHVINPIAMRIGWFSNWVDTFFVKLKYYPEYLHCILRLRNYLFFFVRQERFEGIGLFHSHFIIFQKYHYIYINIFIYDGIFHTKKSELAIEMENLFNLYKRSHLLKSLLNFKKKTYNEKKNVPGLLDDSYYLYQKAADSWIFMQFLVCYCIMTNNSYNPFFNLNFDFITFKKKHPFFNVDLFFKFIKFFNKNQWNGFLRLFKSSLIYKVYDDVKFFNNIKLFNTLHNKNKVLNLNNDLNLKLTYKKFLSIFKFWFKSKLSISTYKNIKKLNFLDLKFIIFNIFPEYCEILNLKNNKNYFLNSIFHNIPYNILKKTKKHLFSFFKTKKKIQLEGSKVKQKVFVFYKYFINYYTWYMRKNKNKTFILNSNNFWINVLYNSIFLNVLKLKKNYKNLKIKCMHNKKYINRFNFIGYLNKKKNKYNNYFFFKANNNLSLFPAYCINTYYNKLYYYKYNNINNNINIYNKYLYYYNLRLIFYNKWCKKKNNIKKINFSYIYKKSKKFCFKNSYYNIHFKKPFFKMNSNFINYSLNKLSKSNVCFFRFYSKKRYYYFHKYAYKCIYKYAYNNSRFYLRVNYFNLFLKQKNNLPYSLKYYLLINNVIYFFYPINYYFIKLLDEIRKTKLLKHKQDLSFEDKLLLKNVLKKKQLNFNKLFKFILHKFNLNLKKINLNLFRKQLNIIFKGIFLLLKSYYNKIYYFIIYFTPFFTSVSSKLKLLKRCCWTIESILFCKLFNKMKRIYSKMKNLSFNSVLKKLIYYKKMPKTYFFNKSKNKSDLNKINVFLKCILKIHYLKIIKLSYWNKTPEQNLQNVYNYLLKYKDININYKHWLKNLNIFMKIIRNRLIISNNFHKNIRNNKSISMKKLKFKTQFFRFKKKKFKDNDKQDYWYKNNTLRTKNDISFKFNWNFFALFSSLLKKRYIKISKNPTYTENLTLFLITLVLLYTYITPFFIKLLKFTTICLIKLIKYYPLKISYLLINNNQVTGRFLSRYIALKLKNGYSVWELLSPIKKDLNYVRSLTSRPNSSFFSGYLKSLRDDFHLNKYYAGLFVYLLKFFCFFYNKQASFFYNNILFSWLNLDLLFFSTSLYNNVIFNKQIKISCSLLYFLRRSFFTLLMKNKNELTYTFKKFVKDSTFLIKSGIFFNIFSSYLYDDFFSPFEVLCIWDLNSNFYITHKCIFLQNVFFNRYVKHFKYKYSYMDVINYFDINKRNLRSNGWRNNLLGLLGFKISCSGRFSRRDRASHISFIKGKVPLNTLKAKIDYGMFTAPIKNSAICVKVWLNKGFNYVNFEKKISL